jgi:hypothetical protein
MKTKEIPSNSGQATKSIKPIYLFKAQGFTSLSCTIPTSISKRQAQLYQLFLTIMISAAQQRGIRKMAEMPDFGQSQMSHAYSQQPLISTRAKCDVPIASSP